MRSVDLLLPLAQRKAAGADELDSRFASLRRQGKGSGPETWMLDVTLGAIVRAVAACGMSIANLGHPLDVWRCTLAPEHEGIWVEAKGDSPEEAVTRCLVALVKAEDKEAELVSERKRT